MKVRARHLVLGALLSAAGLTTATTSWACTVMANSGSESVSPGNGKAGTQVTAVFKARPEGGPATVVITFQSMSDQTRKDVWSGQTPAPTRNTGFPQDFTMTARFEAPSDIPAGTYTVLGASTNQATPEQIGTFTIDPSTPTGGGGGGGSSSTTLPPIEKEEPATENTTGTGGAVDSSPQQTTTDEAPSSRSLGGSATAPQRPAATGRTAQPSAGSAGAPAVAAPNAVTTEAMPAPAPEALPAPLPSPRSATDQLWSGFSEGPRRSVNGRSLSDPVPAADGGGMTAGLVLLTLGLLALGSTFGVATVRRRRAPAATR